MNAMSRRSALGLGAGLAAAGAVGCSRQQAAPVPGASTSTRAPSPASTKFPSAPTALVVTQTDAERAATAASLKKLNEHPLYSLEYSGAIPQPGKLRNGSQGEVLKPFGCTLFMAAGDPDHILVGRQFDWEPAPAALVTSRPHDGPASVSMCDMRYMGMEGNDPTAPSEAANIARAGVGMLDGMNDHGVFIGCAVDEEGYGEGSYRGGTTVVGGLGFMRLALDRASSVAQVLELLDQLSVYFGQGPLLHYLVADATGDAAVIELHKGKMTVHRKDPSLRYHCMENNHWSGTNEAGRRKSRRYAECAETLRASDGKLTEDGAFDLLSRVRQGHTQWTCVYDLSQRSMAVFTTETPGEKQRVSLR